MSRRVYSQKEDLVGHWSLFKHSVFDTTQNKYKNIYTGQLQRSIDFYSSGNLIITNEDSIKINGTWKITKGGRKITVKTENPYIGFTHITYFKKLDYSDGKFNMPEFIYPIYNSEYDSLEGGYSIYIKTKNTLIAKSDTTKANRYFLEGMEIINGVSKGSHSEAIALLKKANKLRPYYYWEAYYWSAYYSYTEDETSIDEINIALELKPLNAHIYSIRAKIKTYYNNKTSIDDINWAIILEPNNSKFLLQRAYILQYQFKLYNEAINDCNTIIALGESEALGYYHRALINLELFESEKACFDFKKAIELGYAGWTHQMKDCGINYNNK